MVTEDDLGRTRAAERLARENYHEARRHREELELQNAFEKWGACIGAVVVDERGRRGTIVSIEPWIYGGQPWVVVKGIKKDGSVGKRRFRIFPEWTVVSDWAL